MYKVAVMGDYDSIYGFAALGISIFAVDSRDDAARTLKQIASAGYGVIYVTEAVAAEISQEIDAYAGSIMPIIVQIPGISGNTGKGIADVKGSVEKAVGSDILFGNE